MADKITVRIERLDLRLIQGTLLSKLGKMTAYQKYWNPMARKHFPRVISRISRVSNDIHEAITKGDRRD
jgi:recombinational DNA repair protein RecT